MTSIDARIEEADVRGVRSRRGKLSLRQHVVHPQPLLLDTHGISRGTLRKKLKEYGLDA